MADFISRSEKKRLHKQVEALAEEVAQLSNGDLKKFPAGEEIREEVRNIRSLKGGARKRQVKYLAKLLRQGPLEEIYLFVTRRKGSELHAKKQFHAAEQIRDTLINEAMELHQEYLSMQIPFELDWESDVIPVVLTDYPRLEEAELRRLIYQYVVTRNKLHYRELFRVMKAAVDQKERLKRGEGEQEA
ncbi:MAG: ribosome biogenesis factor YjgA [Thermodesulfobacteriota bacterium]